MKPRPRHHISRRGAPSGRSSSVSALATPSVRAETPPARHAREPIDMPSETRALLQAGKLEQTCPSCGRWSAATHYCSWCFRPMGPADWYGNGDKEQRAARMPKSAPENPPSEYRHSVASWPEHWGSYPGVIRGPRDVQTPQAGGPDEKLAYSSIPASSSTLRASGAPPVSGALNEADAPQSLRA
jgi:hypothetical protein